MTSFFDRLTGVHLHSRQKVTIFRPVVATVLVLWLSGVLCVSVCGHHLQQAIAAQTASSATKKMPGGSMAQHACCRARMAQHATVLNSVSDSDADDGACPYQRPSAEAAKKFRATLASAIAVPLIAPPAPVAVAVAEPLVESFRLPDRGGTHLRHCVFLI